MFFKNFTMSESSLNGIPNPLFHSLCFPQRAGHTKKLANNLVGHNFCSILVIPELPPLLALVSEEYTGRLI